MAAAVVGAEPGPVGHGSAHSDLASRRYFTRSLERNRTEVTVFQPQSVFVVIPCYNEARRLRTDLLGGQLMEDPALRLIFVDDGSRDDTAALIKAFCRQFPERAELLSLESNRGKAEAVRMGMAHVLARCSQGLVGFWDADLATPLAELRIFVSILQRRPEIEMVFGARVKLLGRDIVRKPARHYLGRIFATAASQLIGIPIYDTQCGAKLFRVTPELRAVFNRPFVSRWIFDVEIITRFQQLYARDEDRLSRVLYEHPLARWEDVAGSKVKPSHFLFALADLARIAIDKRKSLDVGRVEESQSLPAELTNTDPAADQALAAAASSSVQHGSYRHHG